MRWRISITIALVALAAVSCDQQPVGPVDEAPTAETASFDAQPATVWELPWAGTFNLCGTEIYVEGWTHNTIRYVEDGSGEHMSHYLENTTIHGWAESASGDRWRINDSINMQSQWTWNSAPDVWSTHIQTRTIGLGQAPSFFMNSFFHWTWNANGDLVAYWDFEDSDECPS